MDKRVLIIIPAYNEEECIKGVVDELTEICPEYDYVVVNDCS
ncbi:MAG: glycosyltransferase, partial [Oscillospiraceae bacterium]